MSKRFNDLMDQEHIKKFWLSSKENSQVCLPRNTLYHYTSANAMNSIIQNSNFWLTKSNFMNDMSEIIYARDLFFERLACSKLSEDEKARISKSFKDNIERGLFDDMYVLCFSSNPDSLPLWCYYGKNDGYNIGIDTSFIVDLANSSFIETQSLEKDENGNYAFKKKIEKACIEIEHKEHAAFSYGIKANYVLYSQKEQMDIFDAFLEEIKYLAESSEIDKVLEIQFCLSQLVDFIPFMKHNSYINEEEYRVIIHMHKMQKTDKKIKLDKIQKYRVFNGALIPFISIKLNKTNYFKSIGLSPFNKSDISINGIKEFCKAFPVDIDIMLSEIPSRF